MTALVLAAGKGTRMKTKLPKVLHRVCGRPMVSYVLEAARNAGAGRTILVVGRGAEPVRDALGDEVEYVEQAEQLGTAHAVMQAGPLVDDPGEKLLVLYGDTPLISPDVVRDAAALCTPDVQAVVVTAEPEDPSGYGRVVRRPDGTVQKIVEERDAGPEELQLREINAGIYCFRAGPLYEALKRVGRDNAQGEFYLTDVIGLLADGGATVRALKAPDPVSVLGVNTRKELALAEGIMRERIIDGLMDSGVTFLDPASCFVGADVVIGRDTVIHPYCIIDGRTVIGEDCTIGPSARILDCNIGNGVRIEYSCVEGSRVDDGASIGPYSHIRPGTHIAQSVKVGNFAEIKGSSIGPRTKVPHHSYIGDSTVGEGVNIGAGVVTVNYDGRRKYRTEIGDGSFVGCNTNLVAPVNLGPRAYTAAGSTITRDVPGGALGVSRSPQRNINGWAERKLGKPE